MSFASRQDAGKKLGHLMLEEGVEVDTVVGLPRGGVIVAAEVARLLHKPLDVLAVRKIGHPLHREFAIGALAEGDIVLLDEHHVASNETLRVQVEQILREEKARLRTYAGKFHPSGTLVLRDKKVLIVDDGLATGTTMEAAVLSAKKQSASKIFVAVPVGSRSAILKLERIADLVYVVISDPGLEAVGAYYKSFPQTEDDEVLELLRAEHSHS